MQKNVSGQKIRVFAFTKADNEPATGDAANITMKISGDWGTLTASNDTNPTEKEDGYYWFDLTQAETNYDTIEFYPESSTSTIQVIAVPGTVYPKVTQNVSTGGAFNIANEADNIDSSIKSISFDGVETSGTNASVNFEDGTYHQIDDSANNIDIVYQFDVGGGKTGVELTWKGYLSGGNDEATIQVYNGSGWDTIYTITGKNGSTNDNVVLQLLSTHTGTGADLGKVFVRIECASQSNPTLYTDQLLVSAVNVGQSVGYANGSVWLDTNNGVAGTEPFVNGVADNPVDSIADTFTLLSSIGIPDIHVFNGSNFTLAASSTNKSFLGDNWTIGLGGQDIAGAYIEGASVSGTGVAATEAHFKGCEINTASIGVGHYDFCGILGTLTITTAGDHKFHNCYSAVAGASSPIITKTAGQTISAEFRNWAGGLTLSGLESGDVVTIGGTLGTVTLNGAEGVVEIRGTYKAIVDNRTGSPTLNVDGAILASDVADILVDTNTTITNISALNDISPAEVATEVSDYFETDTKAELAAVPAATSTLKDKIVWLFMLARNKMTSTASEASLKADDGSTEVASSALSDDGSITTRGEFS